MPDRKEAPSVWLIQTAELYERPSIVEARLSKADAHARAAELNAYAEVGPVAPQGEVTDLVHARWHRALCHWQRQHPLKSVRDTSYLQPYERFEVISVPLGGGL